MSFILDALKKSESDRQQKATPDISDVPTAGGQSAAPRLLMAITGLLSILVVILLAVLLWPAADVSPPPAVQQAAPAEKAVPEVPAPTESPGETIPAPSTGQTPAATNVAVAEPPASPAPADDSADIMTADTDNGAETATIEASVAAAPATTPAPPPPTAEETESYLTFNDLRATGKIALPDMHIDLHVYSDIPSERFVFINMNQYRENATLSEGPRLRQITSDGVLLEYVGTTFLLPRE